MSKKSVSWDKLSPAEGEDPALLLLLLRAVACWLGGVGFEGSKEHVAECSTAVVAPLYTFLTCCAVDVPQKHHPFRTSLNAPPVQPSPFFFVVKYT